MDNVMRQLDAEAKRSDRRWAKYLEADRRAHPWMYPVSGNTQGMAPLNGCDCVSCRCFRAGGKADIGPCRKINLNVF